MKNNIFYSLKEASELSDLGINTIKKLLEPKAIIPVKRQGNDVMINSHGMYKLNEISKNAGYYYGESNVLLSWN